MKNQYTGIGQALSAAGQGAMQYTQYTIEEMRAKNLEAIRQKERGEDIAWRESEAEASKARHGEELQQRYDLDAFGALDKGMQDAGSEFSGAITKLQDRKRYLEQKAMDPEVAADPAMLKSIEKQLGNLDQEESRYAALLSASRAKFVRNADPKWLKSRGYRLEDYDMEKTGAPAPTTIKKVDMASPETSKAAAADFNKWLKNNPGKPESEGIKFVESIYGPGAGKMLKFPGKDKAPAAPVLAAAEASPAAASAAPAKKESGPVVARRPAPGSRSGYEYEIFPEDIPESQRNLRTTSGTATSRATSSQTMRQGSGAGNRVPATSRVPAAPLATPIPPPAAAPAEAKKPDAAAAVTDENIDTMISGAAEKHGIADYSDVVKKMAAAESGGEKDRATAKSEVGAIGVLQVMPSGAIAQAKQDGYIDDTFDPTDPQQNIDLAAWYFKYLLGRFDGDVRKSVAAYNWGPTAVAKAGDDWESKLPEETSKYLQKVLGPASA